MISPQEIIVGLTKLNKGNVGSLNSWDAEEIYDVVRKIGIKKLSQGQEQPVDFAPSETYVNDMIVPQLQKIGGDRQMLHTVARGIELKEQATQQLARTVRNAVLLDNWIYNTSVQLDELIESEDTTLGEKSKYNSEILKLSELYDNTREFVEKYYKEQVRTTPAKYNMSGTKESEEKQETRMALNPNFVSEVEGLNRVEIFDELRGS